MLPPGQLEGHYFFLSPTLKRLEPLRRRGLFSHGAQSWVGVDFVARFEALGTPGGQWLCSHLAHLWTIADFVTYFEMLGTSQAVGAM